MNTLPRLVRGTIVRGLKMIKNFEGLVEKVTGEIKEFTEVAVVGLSGGADSTLTAALCVKALGAENVYGVHMPYGDLDVKTFNATSRHVGDSLGILQYTAPVTQISDAIENTISHATEKHLSTVNAGNARSRARMTILYGISHMLNEALGKKVRVVGTGNLSEDFIGYDTKGGDALCDLFPIGELFKSEVYELLQYLAKTEHYFSPGLTNKIIEQAPSAGLWDGQTDEEELGYTYAEMEPVIKEFFYISSQITMRNLLNTGREFTDVENFVIKRHLANKHKHEAPPVVSVRRFCE